MQLPVSLPAFNIDAALRLCKALPQVSRSDAGLLCCCNCSFVNQKEYRFCTNCGFPIYSDSDSLYRYQMRLESRKKLQRQCCVKIEQARNSLYVIAAFSMIGIFYVFSEARQTVITGFVMVLLALIYAGLARWSVTKPFTALLISLIIMVTFTLINTWAELSSPGRTASGFYLFLIQMILIYFLLQGVKCAFRADILEEEFKV
jgi:hypothetical protein